MFTTMPIRLCLPADLVRPRKQLSQPRDYLRPEGLSKKEDHGT